MRWLDRILLIGTVVMLLIAIGVMGPPLLQRFRKTVDVGSQVEPRLAERQWTMVAALSPQCRFCTESMPFYSRLRSTYASVPLVVVGRAGPAELKAYCEANGLKALRYENVTPRDLELAATPTLLLVDPSGVVRSIWRGRLSPAAERSVEAALTAIR